MKYNFELEGCLKSVKYLSDDIAAFNSRKLSMKTSIKLNLDVIMKEVEQEEVHKYVEGNEGDSIQYE